MDSTQRRRLVQETLQKSDKAVSASALSERFHVSRQVIVSDVALLRAEGYDIVSTPRGYLANQERTTEGIRFTIASRHDASVARVKQEIYTIVDLGGRLIDVIVDHPIYGQLCGTLNIASRYDADEFLAKVEGDPSLLLCRLTGGVHLHSISCADEETARRIRDALRAHNILLT